MSPGPSPSLQLTKIEVRMIGTTTLKLNGKGFRECMKRDWTENSFICLMNKIMRGDGRR